MAVTKKQALAVLVPVVLVVCVAIACVLAFAVDWNKSSSTEDAPEAPDAMPTSSGMRGAATAGTFVITSTSIRPAPLSLPLVFTYPISQSDYLFLRGWWCQGSK